MCIRIASVILWRTYDNLGKNTGLLWKFNEYGEVRVMIESHALWDVEWCKFCRPWSVWSTRSILIQVCTICPDLHVQKLKNITIIDKTNYKADAPINSFCAKFSENAVPSANFMF